MKTLYDEPLSEHTTYKFGGKADTYIIAESFDDLQVALSTDKKIFIIGNGSNLIVTDKGFRGTVIEPIFNKISVKGLMLTVEAGASVNDMIDFANLNNLKGLECIAGIPGKLGGLICMNAGFTKPISTLVHSVTVMDYAGNVKIMQKNELEFAYRTSIFQKKKLIVLSANLKLERGYSRAIVQEYLKMRKLSQPTEYPSCGSVFKKNNLKDYQGYGNKKAVVKKSFIVNLGGAKASDVLAIIDHIKQSGAELEAEIVGEL